MLKIKGLGVRMGPAQILEDISLAVGAGEIVALVGANGAGKSTLLRTVSGLIRPSAGEIWFQGERLDALPGHDIVARGVAHVPEGRRVFPFLTVHENLVMGGYTQRDAQRRQAEMARAYELFPRLQERRAQLAGSMSGGEQQMLAIARGLISQPRLIMLDEPSLGLAPKVVQQVFASVQEINRGGTPVLLIEQNAHLALKVAHRAYIIQSGRIVLSGPAGELADHPQVAELYLGSVRRPASD